MASIFSVQNLHTFLRRKNFRPPPPPPSRGPPGPLERKGRRSPPLGAGRSLAPVLAGASPEGVGLVSSAMMLLKKIKIVVGRSSLVPSARFACSGQAKCGRSAPASSVVHLLPIWLLANDARRTTNDGFLRRYCRRFCGRL